MSIHANVVQRPDSTFPVVIKPYKLDISQFGDKVRDQMKFTVTNVSEQSLKLELVASMPGLADIELPSEIGAGKSGRGVIRLLPDVLEQSFEKSFTFELNDTASTRFSVPVKRSVKKPTASGKAEGKQTGGSR